jgi:hypothetical protein
MAKTVMGKNALTDGLLSNKNGRLLVKGIAATALVFAADNFAATASATHLKAAALLVLEAVSRDAIQPHLKKLGPAVAKFAAIGAKASKLEEPPAAANFRD